MTAFWLLFEEFLIRPIRWRLVNLRRWLCGLRGHTWDDELWLAWLEENNHNLAPWRRVGWCRCGEWRINLER